MKASDLQDRTETSDASPGTGRVTRVDGPAKTTGRARYSSDVQLPGQLEGAILRSPHPHAKVVSVDVSAALELDGVHAVITAADVDELTWYEEDAPFFSEVARYVGDEIAAVAAIDAVTAERAVRKIEVQYEVLEHTTDLAVAADRDAWSDPLWSTSEPTVTERGDVSVIDNAPVVISGQFWTPTAIHHALEAHGCVAQWIDDRLTVYASTQAVNGEREKIADLFQLDHNQVRVIAEHVGGGFGAKQVPWKNTIIAAILSRETGRPVRLVLNRREESLSAGKRSATHQELRIGATEDGELLGIEMTAVADGGAYRLGGESADLSGPYLHLYQCENVKTTMRTVYTHTGPAVAFRAPGYVEASFALESLMDDLAIAVDLDPVELRRRNYAERDQQKDIPWSSPEALRESYDRVVEVADWPGSAATANASGIVSGRGFAAHEWMAATAMPPGYAWIELNSDGSIHATTSAQDIGTGTRTALTQVVAEELAADPARVRLTLGDTAAGPPAPASAGSTTIPTMAPALAAAATDLRRQILEEAAAHMDTTPDSLELAGEQVVSTQATDSIAVIDLLEKIAPRVLRGQGGRVETAGDVSVRTFGSAIADVAVNTHTGEVQVKQVVVAPDCGRVINPLLVESQVIGGVIQGIGFALTEQQIIDHNLGIVINPNLEDYLVPTAADSCKIVHAEVGIPDFAANALGVKGIGELPMIPVPAAIANAVANAIGVRPHKLPMTPKSILELIESVTP